MSVCHMSTYLSHLLVCHISRYAGISNVYLCSTYVSVSYDDTCESYVGIYKHMYLYPCMYANPDMGGYDKCLHTQPYIFKLTYPYMIQMDSNMGGYDMDGMDPKMMGEMMGNPMIQALSNTVSFFSVSFLRMYIYICTCRDLFVYTYICMCVYTYI